MQLKIRDLVRSKKLLSLSRNVYEDQVKSDDELPLNRTIEIPSMMIIISGTFLESNKYYPERLKYSNKQI